MLQRDDFFKLIHAGGDALSFDEVQIDTCYSDVTPNETDVSTSFSRRIRLQIPIVSADMDTVTNYKMAIAMAENGGIGVITRYPDIQKQARQVRRVKRHRNGLINSPTTVTENQTIGEVRQMQKEQNLQYSTFPVVDERGILRGLLTSNDFRFSTGDEQLVCDVMTADPMTVIDVVNPETAFKMMMEGGKKSVLPVINSSGKLRGLYLLSDVERIMLNKGPHNVDSSGQLMVAAAVGVGENELKRAELLYDAGVDAFVLSSAHADTKTMIEMLIKLKKQYPDKDVIIGNVSNGESAVRLADNGADAVKVGQGCGSICTTRIVTGTGRAQLSAVYDCANSIHTHGHTTPVIADGGVEYSGHITKALAAGASCVMLGKLLAGTTQAAGDLVGKGNLYKRYRGMGSIAAMQEGSADRYSQSTTGKDNLVPEGVEGLVPYDGDLADVLHQLVGGLRSGMGSTGSKTIHDLRENARFCRISAAGLRESHPHGLAYIESTLNYRSNTGNE